MIRCNRSVVRRFLHGAVMGMVALLTALFAWGTASPVQAADGPPYLVEYAIAGKPLNIAVEAPGKVWVTLPAENKIGRLTVRSTTDFDFDTFPVPTAGSQPYDLVFRSGVVWFTEKSGNKIGKLTVSSGVIQEFAIPTAGSQPTGIDVASNGRVWFVEQAGNKLAQLNPSNGAITEHAVPAEVSGGGLEDVAVRSTNEIWFTAPLLNRTAAYQIDRDAFDIVATQTPTERRDGPITIVMDPSSRPWVTANGSDSLGRYTPETLNFWKWFDLSTRAVGITGLSIRDIGDRWQVFYTGRDANHVGMLTVRESDTRVLDSVALQLLTPNSKPWGIAADGDGHAWIAESNAQVIAEWRPAYADRSHQLYMPFVTVR